VEQNLLSGALTAPQEIHRASTNNILDAKIEKMWIGVFDSGLGGLALAEAIRRRLPEYNYLYLGDTKRVPYGNRSQESIHEFVSQALNFLFENDCRLVVLACNTAAAEALRKSQQDYLPRFYPERRILGVIIPTVEAAVADLGSERCGVLATQSTVDSGAYLREFERLGFGGQLFQQPAPLLVPLIEGDGLKYIEPVIDDYLISLKTSQVDTILLGCTHYCLVKELVAARSGCRVISQDDVVPEKLADYLRRHPEMDEHLSKEGRVRYCVTDCTSTYAAFATRLAGRELDIEKVSLT
jgi:glutamate racemase